MNRKTATIIVVLGIFLAFGISSVEANKPFSDSDINNNYNVTIDNHTIVIKSFDETLNVSYFVNYTGSKIRLKDITIPSTIIDHIFERVSNRDYKFSLNVTNIPLQISGVGLTIENNSNHVQIEESVFTIDFNDFAITMDFSDISYLNPQIDEENITIYIDLLGAKNLEFDPTITFTDDQVEGVDIAAIDENRFGMVWCDEGLNDIYFRTYYANGTTISSEVTVDSSVSSCPLAYKSVSIAPLNDSWFVVAYPDNDDDDATVAIYDVDGNEMLSPTDIDTDMDFIYSIAVDAFNDSAFIVAWHNGTTGEPPKDGLVYGIFDISGNTLVSETAIEDWKGTTGPESLDVVTLNETYAVIAWHSDVDSDASFIIVDESGNTLVSETDVDTDVGGGNSYCAVSVSAFNETHFVFGFSDNAASNVKTAIYDSSGNVETTNTVEDLRYIGVNSAKSVSVTTLNESWYAISYYDNEGTVGIEVADYDGNQRVSRINVSDASDALTNYESLTSTFVSRNIGFCENNLVVAYVNATTGNYTTYTAELGSWDGACDPVISANETSPPEDSPIEHGDSVYISLTVTDPDFNLTEVNCTVEASDGTKYIDNENATLGSGNVWNSSSFDVSVEGTNNVSCTAKDSDGKTDFITWNFTTYVFTGVPDIANATWIASKMTDTSTTFNIEIGNSGDYNLTNCNMSFTNSLSASATYSLSDFNITNTTNRTVIVTLPSGGSAGTDSSAVVTVNCTSNATNEYDTDSVTGSLVILEGGGSGGGPSGGGAGDACGDGICVYPETSVTCAIDCKEVSFYVEPKFLEYPAVPGSKIVCIGSLEGCVVSLVNNGTDDINVTVTIRETIDDSYTWANLIDESGNLTKKMNVWVPAETTKLVTVSVVIPNETEEGIYQFNIEFESSRNKEIFKYFVDVSYTAGGISGLFMILGAGYEISPGFIWYNWYTLLIGIAFIITTFSIWVRI